MWVFLTARIRQWLILAVLVPLITTVIHLIRERIEARSGPTRVSRTLGRVEQLGQRTRRR